MRKQKTIKHKNTRDFLKNQFPENLRPVRKLVKKDKKLIGKKFGLLFLIKKNKKEFEKTLKKKKLKGLVKTRDASFSGLQSPNQRAFTKLGSNQTSLVKSKYTAPLVRAEFKKTTLLDGTPSNIFLKASIDSINRRPLGFTYPKHGPNQTSMLKSEFAARSVRTKDSQSQIVHFLYSSDIAKRKLLGIENKNRFFSEFLYKLKEMKKFSIIYGGISRKYLQKALLRAQKSTGRINENLIIQLEKRLDVLLYRICFFKSINSARQAISHNWVLINGITVNIPNFLVKEGDIVSIKPEKRKDLVNQISNFLTKCLSGPYGKRRIRFLISTKVITASENNIRLGKTGFSVLDKKHQDFPIGSTRTGSKALTKQNLVIRNTSFAIRSASLRIQKVLHSIKALNRLFFKQPKRPDRRASHIHQTSTLKTLAIGKTPFRNLQALGQVPHTPYVQNEKKNFRQSLEDFEQSKGHLRSMANQTVTKRSLGSKDTSQTALGYRLVRTAKQTKSIYKNLSPYKKKQKQKKILKCFFKLNLLCKFVALYQRAQSTAKAIEKGYAERLSSANHTGLRNPNQTLFAKGTIDKGLTGSTQRGDKAQLRKSPIFDEKNYNRFFLLYLKRLMHCNFTRKKRLLAKRLSGMKPLNVEISYKLLQAIVLFSPQKITYPTLLNIDLVSRAITKK